MEHSSDTEPTSVYEYFDELDALIYVGMTSRGTARNVEHNKGKQWWQYVTSQRVTHHPDRQTAHQQEVALIRRFRPPFNVQHNADHERTRAAYLAAREVLLPALHADPAQQLARYGKRIPVEVRDCGNGPSDVEVHFSLDVLAMARRIELPPKCRVLAGDSGQVVGRLARIEHRGPYVVIHGDVSREWCERGGVANLKVVTAKGGPRFRLSCIRAGSEAPRPSW